MWLITKLGFYSIVQDFDSADILHVRARVAGDLERVLAATGIDKPVTTTPDADYRYRVAVSRDELLRLLAVLGNAIDYPNFKNEVARHAEQRGRLPAYHEVWHTLQTLQKP
jgi:hypothetical protein